MVDFSVNSVNSYGAVQNVPKPQGVSTPDNLKRYYSTDEELNRKVYSQAIKAYNAPNIKIRPHNLDDFVKRLIASGKKPRKDFYISKAEIGNYAVYLMNDKEQKVKTMYYDKDKKFSGYDTTMHNEAGQMTRDTSYDSDGKMKLYEDYYYNVPPENFTEDKLTFETTFDDYVDNLKAQGKVEGKDFTIEHNDKHGEYQNESYRVIENNPDGSLKQNTHWFHAEGKVAFVSRSEYVADEKEDKRTTFGHDGSISVCHYAKNFKMYAS